MKKLFVVRHAKSSRSIMDLEDIARPLNERGYSDAQLVSSHLKKEIEKPFLLVSSPAIRAFSTALVFSKEFSYDPENIILSSELYETDAETYLKVICRQSDSYNSLMIVGHNPTISDIIEKLSLSFEKDVPTCAVAIFSVKAEKWADILSSEKALIGYLIPSDYKEKSNNSPEK